MQFNDKKELYNFQEKWGLECQDKFPEIVQIPKIFSFNQRKQT